MVTTAFFDIDGTLRSDTTGTVPQRTKHAIAALRERGVRVVIATGRHPIELDGAGLDGMTFDGFAAANGQMCLDSERRLFAGYPLSDAGVQALVDLCDEGRLVWFFGESEHYASRADGDLAALSLATTGLLPEERRYDGMVVYQAVAFVSVAEEAALAARLPECRLQRWGTLGVDIIAADGGKVEGMKAFLERFGTERDDCIAFGDQHNDIDMLHFAGVGIAMGNAAPEVKEAADMVTRDVDDDGVAWALEQLGVLEDGWESSDELL